MSEEISAKNVFINCECGEEGCLKKGSVQDAFNNVYEIFENMQEGFKAIGLALHMIKKILTKLKGKKTMLITPM